MRDTVAHSSGSFGGHYPVWTDQAGWPPGSSTMRLAAARVGTIMRSLFFDRQRDPAQWQTETVIGQLDSDKFSPTQIQMALGTVVWRA